MKQPVTEHEGSKYLRWITSAVDPSQKVQVDVYAVLKAFEVECQATGHAVKKLLCAGIRGKGSVEDDLVGAMAALNRAIELAEEKTERSEKVRKYVAEMNARGIEPPKEGAEG